MLLNRIFSIVISHQNSNRIKKYLNTYSVSRCFFHRRTSTNLSRKRINHQYSINKKDKHNETKRYFYYGILVLSSIFFFYIYEHRNKIHLLDPAKLLSEDINDKNSVNEKKKKKKSNEEKCLPMNFFADIVEETSPSVAFIQAQGQHPFLPMAMNISSGSGFLVDKDEGIILTNAHVIANCQKVTVQFKDGRAMDGAVEFVDERLDLATVRVPLSLIKDLEPVPLGDSKQTRAGEWVIAVGSPFSLSNTVTVGVVSSISRAGRDLGIRDNIEYIQTDASINIGNSGGPLLNLDGKAIGINTLKVGEGISFAIPAYYADEFLKKCKKFRVQKRNDTSWYNRRNDIDSISEISAPIPKHRIYFGFSLVTLTPHLIESHRHRDPNFPSDVLSGVLIYRVVLGAPAHLSGLESGDIILAINGKEVRTADEVFRIIQSENSNVMEFSIKRSRQNLKIKVKPNVS